VHAGQRRLRAPRGIPGGRRGDVGDEEIFLECLPPRYRPSVGARDHAASVEHELVLSADEVEVAETAAVLAGAPLHEPLALRSLAAVVRRGRDIDDDARAAQANLRGRRAVVDPDVLADVHADHGAAEIHHERVLAGLEVSLLVENAVVRQVDLAIGRGDLPSEEHVAGVVRAAARARRRFGGADENGDPAHIAGGYPLSMSSGNATICAPRRLASAAVRRTLSTLPARSPTVGLIWARAIRILALSAFISTVPPNESERF
jgi:hypothetical protein